MHTIKILTEVFSSFTQFLQANTRMVPQARPLPLRSIFLPLNYSRIIVLPYGATEQLTLPLISEASVLIPTVLSQSTATFVGK
jgi:hypothetical protein